MQRVGSLLLRYLPGQITCGEFESFLLDYHEERLPEADRVLFERHMRVCPMCRTSLKTYLKTIEMEKCLFPNSVRNEQFKDAPQELIDAILLTALQHTADS